MPTKNGGEVGRKIRDRIQAHKSEIKIKLQVSKLCNVVYLAAARVLEMIITTTCSIYEKGTYNAKNHVASIHVHHMARHIPKVSICLTP